LFGDWTLKKCVICGQGDLQLLANMLWGKKENGHQKYTKYPNLEDVKCVARAIREGNTNALKFLHSELAGLMESVKIVVVGDDTP